MMLCDPPRWSMEAGKHRALPTLPHDPSAMGTRVSLEEFRFHDLFHLEFESAYRLLDPNLPRNLDDSLWYPLPNLYYSFQDSAGRKSLFAPFSTYRRCQSQVRGVIVSPKNQAGNKHNPGHVAHEESQFPQQQLENIACAWNSTLPDFPLAEGNMQAAHASKASR
jgi:hypothetical protein